MTTGPDSSLSSVRPRRRILLLEWISAVIGGTLIFTALRVWMIAVNYQPQPGEHFEPWSDLPAMYVLAPAGWIFLGMLGPLWIVLAGLAVTLAARSRKGHLLTALGTAIFGTFWPWLFRASMGV